MRPAWFIAALTLVACRAQRADPPRTLQPPEFVQARAAVVALLRDPDSARFGRLERGSTGAVCGTFNARNGYGGFTGFEPFAWSRSTGAILYEAPDGWRDRGRIAEQFADLGCSIGPDQAKAVAALEALEASDARIRAGLY